MSLVMMTGPEFVRTMQSLTRLRGNLQSTIRDAMTASLGDMPAIVALAYTGDVEDGDLSAFVKRTEELFGTSAQSVLTNIASWATRHAKD